MRSFAHPIAFVAALVAVSVSAPPAARAGEGGGGWKKAKSKAGVVIYTREKEGSQYLEVKGTGTVDATPDEVFAFLSDMGNYKKLSPSLKEAKDLGSCGEGCRYIYERVGQWPVTDRHWVFEQRVVEKGEGSWVFSWKVSGKKKPEGEGAIAVTEHTGSWTVSPADGKTRVVYRNHIEMGGDIPVDFVNNGSVKGALDFYINLRKSI